MVSPGVGDVGRKGRSGPRFLLLMTFLFVEFAFYPVLREERILGAHLFTLFTVLVLAAVVYSIATNRTQRIVMAVLSALVTGLQYAGTVSRPAALDFAGIALYTALLLYTAVVILRYVFNDEPVTTNKIYGAVSAYLLLGYLWAFIYAMLELAMPGAFLVSEAFSEHGTTEFLADDRMAMFFYY
ncbi:MAG: hypothetical protein GWO24_36160, partial [Akkermansiaceae bacterium]|nr:hypothetical protein [Akkermansiaceae bacterium]